MKKNRINITELFQSKKHPLVLDGAIGSYLQNKGFISDPVFWYSKYNLTNPSIVKTVHQEYINAGADIITTNTFRTNLSTFNKHIENIDWKYFVKESVAIVSELVGDSEIIIAGSNPPAEDCYQAYRTLSMKELDMNHKKHIEQLWESGVDIIWNETQSHLDEIEIIAKFCSENSLPFGVNLYMKDDLKLLSGEPVNEVIDIIEPFQPIIIGFNCIKPNIFQKYISTFPLPKNWGFYFNCGAGDVTDTSISCELDPDKYLTLVKELIENEPTFIGSCCGSNPNHTKKIKDYINELY